MESPHEMKTVSEILEKLRLEKKDAEFRMTDEGFKAIQSNQVFKPDELHISKTYRFEGNSDPSDNAVIYIIEANNGLIGYALDAYGVYSNYEDDSFDKFIAQIQHITHT
ncbi:hypothetical protein NF867_17400 [Solitalea sp. MAHUQ-68]|uniref:Phosphoribosylpyrophosphate synthetase n=1 Tax=Solitalea agri TaxID=2953739 RepID=A0A9X2JGP6_9SPHI|nr:hypothetical protein [Solitalea agri]MCO4294641.1 hypothetical protein [Solitalea agri]